MKNTLRVLLVLTALTLTAAIAWAGDSSTKIGGTFYFDYFVNTTDGADEGDDAVRGWQLRRTYLTIKKSSEDLLFRYTSDVHYSEETGNLNTFTKYAYVQRKCMMIPGSNLIFGLHSPKTHSWVEGRWHYRSMAKTMSDMNKWTHAAQMGVGLQGKAADGTVEYFFDFNNGNGYKKAVAKDGMGFAGRLAFQPLPGLHLSGIFTSNTPGGDMTEANTYLEGLVGYDAGIFELYGQYGLYTNGNTDDQKSSGISVFGRAPLLDGLFLTARYDIIDPDIDVDNDDHSFIFFGLDLMALENLFVQPSYRMTQYTADGMDSESEFVLTFYGKI